MTSSHPDAVRHAVRCQLQVLLTRALRRIFGIADLLTSRSLCPTIPQHAHQRRFFSAPDYHARNTQAHQGNSCRINEAKAFFEGVTVFQMLGTVPEQLRREARARPLHLTTRQPSTDARQQLLPPWLAPLHPIHWLGGFS